MKRGFTEIGLDVVHHEMSTLKMRLDSIGVPFFLMAGTLLGAMRHGALIPYDRDVDLGVMSEDTLTTIYEKIGSLYTHCFFTGENIPAAKTLWLVEDFGEYELPFEFQCHYRQKEVVFYNREMDDTWKCWETHVEYPAHLFESFVPVLLNKEPYSAPNSPEEWLKVFYGEDWKTPKNYSDWRYNCPIFLSGYMSPRP